MTASLRKAERALLPHAGFIWSSFLCKCSAIGTFFFSNQLVFDLESVGVPSEAQNTCNFSKRFPMSWTRGNAAFEACSEASFMRGSIDAVFLLYLNTFTAESVVVTRSLTAKTSTLCPPGKPARYWNRLRQTGLIWSLNHGAVFTFSRDTVSII